MMKSLFCLVLCFVWVGAYAVPTNPIIKITPNPTNPSAITQTLPVGSFYTQRICSGQQVKLEAVASGTGTLAYQWIHLQTGSVVGTTAIITLALADGQYNVKITDETGTTTSSTVIQICVETEPPFNATLTSNGATSICTSGNAPDLVLTANASNVTTTPACSTPDFKYKWYKNNVLISGATSATFTLGQQVSNAGTYKVEVYNACGFDDATLTIGIADSPPMDVNIYTDDASNIVCQGNSLVLRVTAIGVVDNYQWFKQGTPVVIGMGNSFTVSDAGTYYVKAKNGCGEKVSGNFVVTVSSAPAGVTLASNPFDGALCKDMSVLLAPINLLGGAPTRLEYYKGEQLVHIANFPFTNGLAYQATQTGTYKVKVVNKCGSFMSGTKDVVASNGATSASLDLTGISPSLGCGITEITVGVKANGTVDGYNWILDGGALGDLNPTLTINMEGEYYAEVFSACGVYYTDTIHVITVNAPPLSNINLSSAGGLTTCEGKIMLTCTDAGAGCAYKWFKDGVLYNTNAKNSLEATESGTYTVQASNACGESNVSNGIALIVKKKANKPTITAPIGSDFCGATGSVLLLMNSFIETGIEYQWLKNGTPIAGANDISYEAIESATYTLRASNPANDCPAEVSEPIQVRFIVAPVLANLFIQMNVCESPLVLRAISSGNFLQYRWILLNGTTNPEVGNGETFMPTTSGVYAVSVRNDCLPAGLWLTSQSVTATVSSTGGAIPIPEIVSEPLGIDRICPNTSLKLKAQTSTALPNPAYRWFLGDDMITGATTGEIMVSNSGLYRVEIYSPQNPTCGQISSAYSIFVRPVPTLLLSYNPSLTFCEGDSIRLNANAQQVPSLYAWTLGGTALQNGNVLYAKEDGEYTVKGVYNAGTLSFPCDFETTRTIETTRLPAPVPEIVLKGGLLESKNIAESYQWNYEGVPVLGATNPFYMPVDSGRYTLTVTNDLGCSGTSNAVMHKGIYDHTPPLEISPNPNQGTFRVTVVGKEAVAMVEVYNAQGKLISASSPALRVNSLASHTEITFRGLARGVYLVRATVGENVYAKRVVVL